MKKKLFYLFVCISNFVLCQNNVEDIVKPRLSFVSDKNIATDLSKIIVLEKDTLFSKYKTYDLTFLNDSLYSEDFFFKYEYMVFQFTDENSKKIYHIQQWSTPIIVYLDKELPKTVRKEFEEFYSQIKGIKNLKISFTTKLENANYFVKATSKTVNGYDNDYKFPDEESRRNNVLTGSTFKLQSDYNNKYFSGILTVNPSEKDETLLLKQLKQMFFMSLGRFFVSNEFEEESILSSKYVNSKVVSQSDLDILKVHYEIIYDQAINGTTFKKLKEIANNN